MRRCRVRGRAGRKRADPPARAGAISASFNGWIARDPKKAIAYALADGNQEAATRRQVMLELLDQAYSEGTDKQGMSQGFGQLSPTQQAQVKERITSSFDADAAKKVLELFQ